MNAEYEKLLEKLKVAQAAAVYAAKHMKERCAQVADRFGAPPHYIAAAIRALDASPQRIEDQESVMRAFSASDAACYKWPEDTPEQKALRAAYIEGAATASNDQLDWARGPDLEDIISKAKAEREACAQRSFISFLPLA